MTKTELFLKLAQPDEHGKSRWVYITEFVEEYATLKFGNGASWARKESTLAKNYKIEFDKSITPGNGIDALRLVGHNEDNFSQYISAAIKKKIKSQRCVVLGTSNPEVDHKNGMKNESRVMQNEDQKLSDFQPLSKAANDAKRQYCKECRESGIRYDAKLLTAKHNHEENACIGCYWYDPLEFKRHLTEKI